MTEQNMKSTTSASEKHRLAMVQAEVKLQDAKRAWESSMREEANEAITSATKILRDYAQFITRPELNAIGFALNAVVTLNDESDEKATKKSSVKTDKKPIADKFEVNGRAWSGRGITPKEFEEWDKSQEGKDWHKKHPKQRYPFVDGYEPNAKDLDWTPMTDEQRAEAKRLREEAKAKKTAA